MAGALKDLNHSRYFGEIHLWTQVGMRLQTQPHVVRHRLDYFENISIMQYRVLGMEVRVLAEWLQVGVGHARGDGESALAGGTATHLLLVRSGSTAPWLM